MKRRLFTPETVLAILAVITIALVVIAVYFIVEWVKENK